MRSDWLFPICSGGERLKGDDGKKVHPTQKPEALLARILMASTKPGDVVLDPFFGSGTTGAVAKRLGRHFVGIEREQAYIDAAAERIAAVEPLGKATLSVMTGKKAEPRVAFNTLIESGLIKPGTVLTDARRRYSAIVRADGTVASGGDAGSIHRLGAKVQGLDACNGWTFWHYDDGKSLQPDRRPARRHPQRHGQAQLSIETGFESIAKRRASARMRGVSVALHRVGRSKSALGSACRGDMIISKQSGNSRADSRWSARARPASQQMQ